MKTLFMETTAIPPERTAAEIMSLLVKAGSRQVLLEYGPDGKLSGLRFVLEIRPGNLQPFRLPARVEPIFKIISGRRTRPSTRDKNVSQDRRQAERVAWRQLLRWIQAQVAMIESGMVEAGEVFLPYLLQGGEGLTFWERAISGQLALPPAPDTVVPFERKQS